MKQFLLKIKEYFMIILAIVFIVVIFVGIVMFVMYLKQKDKKLQITPELKVIEAKQEDQLDAISESVGIAQDILSKVKK